MPHYDYRCENCNETFEKWVSFAADPNQLQNCPRCSQMKGKKILVVPAIVFKGKGFYRTDNNNATNNDRA